MSALDRVGSKVIENLGGSDDIEAAFDVGTLDIVMQLIMGLMEAFKNCKKTEEEAVKMINNPSVLQRVALRGRVRRELSNADRKFGGRFHSALLAAGKTVTKDDVEELYQEV